MSDETDDADRQQIRRERDLYRRLLDLGRQPSLDPFLKEALALVVEITGAAQGYIEVREEDAEDVWAMGCGFSSDELATVRERISRGIVAEALATGTTIVTHSALLDERFEARASVQAQRIEAVLCAPIASDGARGVVYLQGRAASDFFDEADKERVELLARHLAPLADRLLVRRRFDETRDPTRDLRARYRIAGVVGRSRPLAIALEQAMLAAPLDVNVLLTGQSGTGKSQIARAIHDNSPRAAGPFVEVNCGAINQNLFENELFGSVPGGHSNAPRAQTDGKVGAAEGGTLFLDEIAEIPFDAQSKLLQLIQSKRYYKVGASVPTSGNLRVVAATNRDLEQAVADKTFREDLYYRLQVLPIRMPSLSERRGDIPDLAAALIVRLAERYDKFVPLPLSPAAERALSAEDWPGNIRQLENTLAGALIRAHGRQATEIAVEHLFPERASDPDDPSGGSPGGPLTYEEATRRFQRDLLVVALKETKWNVAATARRLGLARSHVYNLIAQHGLTRER
jgi:Nif-specific regulatory protein